MKALVIFFIGSISVFAQIDTSIWYPLDVGNYWEYMTNNDSWTETYEVVKDTLMPNGQSYAKIRHCSSGSRFCGYVFQRVEDNSFVYFYDSWSDSEYKFYDFSIQENEYWDFGRTRHLRFLDFNSETDSQIFGDTLVIKRFEEHKLMPDTVGFTYETIAKGIGPIVFGWYIGYEESDSTTLVGAIIKGQQYGRITSAEKLEEIPAEYNLQQNYPNPFNPSTTINYTLTASCNVIIEIYNLLGEKVKTLVNDFQNRGIHKVEFNGKYFSSGIYFYKISTIDYSATKKMLLLK